MRIGMTGASAIVVALMGAAGTAGADDARIATTVTPQAMLVAYANTSDGFLGGGMWGPGPEASLHDADGTPLEGKTISFTRDGELICEGVTNANGRASCSLGGLAQGRFHENFGGFTAAFAGDEVYQPHADEGFVLILEDGDGHWLRVHGDETLLAFKGW